jgi:hypothetical protein
LSRLFPLSKQLTNDTEVEAASFHVSQLPLSENTDKANKNAKPNETKAKGGLL